MGSTQGTLINGSKVSKAKLNHGDQITVGDTVLAVGFGGPAVAETAAASVAAPVQAAPAAPVAAASATPAAGIMRPMAFATAGAGEAARQPVFDSNAHANPPEPVRRITQERMRTLTESKPHPAIAPEEPLSADNRILELRFYWGEVLLGMWHHDKPKRVTIGENNRTDIFLSSESLPTEEFPLIRYKDGDYLISVTNQMEGEVETGGETQSLRKAISSGWARKDDELADTYRIKMAMDTRGVVHWGGATFAMRFVPRPVVTKESFWKSLDLQYINATILSLFLHIAIVVTLAVYPHDTEALKVDLFGEPDRFASLILEAPKENKSTKDMLEKIKKSVEEKKEEIKQPEEKKKPLDISKTIVPKNMPAPKKSVEEKKQEVAKKFAKLFSGSEGAAGNILGGGGAGSLSGQLQNVIGTAGTGSSSAGLQGIGIRGTGPLTGGGIGTSRGIAGIGTTGRLGGGGLGYGAGIGLGTAKEHNVIGIETPTIEGALAADVIKKVINENKNQVRYCYEVELQRNQNLEGRVVVRWVIGATGEVAQALVAESTIKNANVEECLIGKIKKWKFPPPAGGGTVEVKYPFVFKAS